MAEPRIFGICGRKNAGKTHLVTGLLPLLIARGLRVSTLKHSHHPIDPGQAGGDSARHAAAGAQEAMVVDGEGKLFVNARLHPASDQGFADLFRWFRPVDLILVEGFKASPHPKLEVWRSICLEPPLGAALLPALRAEVRENCQGRGPLPCFGAEDTASIADFILRSACTLADLPA